MKLGNRAQQRLGYLSHWSPEKVRGWGLPEVRVKDRRLKNREAIKSGKSKA